MTDKQTSQFTIIGAGLGGALMANYLARAGHRVDVYERRSDPRRAGFVGGRSINLAISERGINGLRGVGLADETMKMAIPMRGRMIHTPDGSLKFQPYDRDPRRCINSISRGGLNLALLEAAERYDNVRLHFDCKCEEVDLERPAARIVRKVATGAMPTPQARACPRQGATPRIEEFWTEADAILGADGAFSAVRLALQKQERFDYGQSYLAHGYKELTIPPGEDGVHRMEKHALHIWPRRAFMMIALPNPDGSFTCTCFWPFQGTNSFDSVQRDPEIRRFFERQFPDAVPLMPTLVEDYQHNPIGSLVTIRCAPWHHGGKAVLLGDAAHAIVPFYGQGMNAAFEDCVVLDDCLRRHPGDLEYGFFEYYELRKRNAEAICDLALHNFIEMRDHTGKRLFRIRKAIERGLEGLLPGIYVPLYTMISFTNVPYAEAVRRAGKQDRIVVVAALALVTLLIVLGLLTIL